MKFILSLLNKARNLFANVSHFDSAYTETKERISVEAEKFMLGYKDRLKNHYFFASPDISYDGSEMIARFNIMYSATGSVYEEYTVCAIEISAYNGRIDIYVEEKEFSVDEYSAAYICVDNFVKLNDDYLTEYGP